MIKKRVLYLFVNRQGKVKVKRVMLGGIYAIPDGLDAEADFLHAHPPSKRMIETLAGQGYTFCNWHIVEVEDKPHRAAMKI